MTQEQRERIKHDVTQKITLLKKNIDNLKELTKPIGPDRAFGKVGRIDAMSYQSMQEAALSSSQQRLLFLEDTLARIDSAKFGICSYCKGNIGFERIKALPETNKCIECAEKYGI